MRRKVVTETKIDKNGIEHYYRDGVELDKGFNLTEAWIKRHRKNIEKICQIYCAYPDIYIDLITPTESQFQLYFYQRIFLRACMRYRYHYCDAPRA